MKKILLLVPAFLLAFQISKAQTEKGSQTLGVNLIFNTQKSSNVSVNPSTGTSSNTKNKYNNFGIGPNYSYFIADKLDIGANLSYDHLSVDNGEFSSPSTHHQYDYGAQIFIRKYFMYGDKLGLRAGPYLGYSRYNVKYTYDYPGAAVNSNSSKTDSYNAGINLGLVYYPTKKIGVSATLANIYYAHSKSDDGAQSHGSTDSFNGSFISNGLGLSLFYVFGAK
ncbi:autotransporter outer membrane beta-barrel domain-containing protein [Mucilaginibacter sp. OK283]|uniref:autotransporter outer membrane beta-barrel domain-containing protein n=1 Tax=Mucilaginibacter sp. OK283 TaxID=1881049 RepID=UPI0008B994CB|nr:autotransporter outer membrane beta-barrel domain-containing protein [Mucilaginibacter sp. OK283]SEP44220.1 hypothetical protein SAMN05428947_11999 [Mucilaginibacter sp. OK283]